jgi:MEMO1 family protein
MKMVRGPRLSATWRSTSELAEKISGEFAFRIETASRYEQDNTIEVQLPFIKYFFPESRILPHRCPPKPEVA